MKLKSIVLRASSLYAHVLAASAASSPFVVHEKRYASTGLRQGRRVDSTSVVTFQIGLKQSNLELGYEYLLNISHPASPHYGKVWSAEEVRRTFSPSRQAVDTVHEWLTSAGIEDVTEKRGWLSFQSTVGYVENMLKTVYFEHEDGETESVRIGCERYHLPEHISKHVDYITPGVALSVPLEKRSLSRRQPPSRQGAQPRWPYPKSKRNSGRHLQSADWSNQDSEPHYSSPRNAQLPPDLQDCGRRVTPVCIRALYGLPSPEEVASSYSNSPTNSLGVFEDGGSYNQSDLDLFFSLYAPEIPAGTGPIPHLVNAPPQGDRPTNGETALDLMIMFPIVYPQTITLYQVESRINGGRIEGESYAGFHIAIQELLDAVDASFCKYDPIPHSKGKDCGTYPPTRVISISYGTAEIIQPESYLKRQCNEFMKLSLQGTTFTISSGDYGVAAQPGFNKVVRGPSNGCIVAGSYNGTASPYYSLNGTVFSTQWPATCPYILSVGATQLGRNETVGDAESVMDLPHYEGIYTKDDFKFASSGGFSNYFSRPSYQNNAIESYFSQHDPGYPYYTFNGVDFSQPGNNVGANGGLYNRAGRGIPDVSAIGRHVPVIDDGAPGIEAGTSCAAPIWGSIFTLINEKRAQAGKGPVGFVNPVLYEHPEVFNDVTLGRNPGCFTKGFSAVKGWDPVTGLGTPNFPKLLELFLSLP